MGARIESLGRLKGKRGGAATGAKAFFWIVLIILMGVGLFLLPSLLVRRAISKVIAVFQKHGALGPDRAKTLDELGLKPLGLLDRMTRMRDYKPYALQALMKAEVVRRTEDGRLYLSEESLAQFLKHK
jgi:hypothetical protein